MPFKFVCIRKQCFNTPNYSILTIISLPCYKADVLMHNLINFFFTKYISVAELTSRATCINLTCTKI